MNYQFLYEIPCGSCKIDRAITIYSSASNEDAALKKAGNVALHQFNFHLCKKCNPQDNTCNECKTIEKDAYILYPQIVSNQKIQTSFDKKDIVQGIREQGNIHAFLRRMILQHKIVWPIEYVDVDQFTAAFQKQIDQLLRRFTHEELTHEERREVSKIFHQILRHQLNTETCRHCA